MGDPGGAHRSGGGGVSAQVVYVNPTSLSALGIRRRLGIRDWSAPERFGPDGWSFVHLREPASIIVTVSPAREDGFEWIHVSVARRDRMPSYEDLKLLHAAVLEGRWAYQVFAPPTDHANIHEHALHLWSRLDGSPALPDFTDGTGSI